MIGHRAEAGRTISARADVYVSCRGKPRLYVMWDYGEMTLEIELSETDKEKLLAEMAKLLASPSTVGRQYEWHCVPTGVT